LEEAAPIPLFPEDIFPPIAPIQKAAFTLDPELPQRALDPDRDPTFPP
jgi:hypothetical protein